MGGILRTGRMLRNGRVCLGGYGSGMLWIWEDMGGIVDAGAMAGWKITGDGIGDIPGHIIRKPKNSLKPPTRLLFFSISFSDSRDCKYDANRNANPVRTWLLRRWPGL